MNKYFKIILVSISTILLAWILPDTYHFVTTKKISYPFTLYSPQLKDFLVQESEGKTLFYNDTQGNRYTSNKTDSLVPTLYYRQLITDNRFPDTLMGVSVTPQLISKTNFFFRHSPRDINAHNVQLYPLLESRPKRIELSMPDDVVRFTDTNIQFIDMETNRVKPQKSELFQKVMNQKGVQLPIKKIAGNPNALKDYDEGYFFTDSKNQLFHLKQMVGQPFLRHIDIDTSIAIKQIFITEYPSRYTFAFVVDENHNFYVLTAPDYRLVKTAIPAFNPDEDAMMIIGNMFDWNVKITNNYSITNYALDASNYSLIDTLSTPLQTSKWETTSKYIFPFELKFTSHLNKYFKPHINNWSVYALFLNILLAVAFVFIQRKSNYLHLVIPSLGILAMGLFAFIPLLIYRKA